jgi:hypothetical protein
MLKGKKSLYILLPLNLAIWGFAAFKILKAFSSDDKTTIERPVPEVNFFRNEDSLTYILSLDYDDPFLKDVAQSSNVVKPSSIVRKETQTVKPRIVPVATKTVDIKYLGLVQNKTTGTTTAMVLINGKSHLVKPGESVDDITFASINSDILNVKIGKDKVIIRK